MYNFVFWFFYRYFEWRKRFRSVLVATSMVGVTMTIHLALINLILRAMGLYIMEPWEGPYGSRKYLLIFAALIFFLLLYLFYYKKNSQEILEKHKGEKFSDLKNVIKIMLILVVPLVFFFLISEVQ